MCTFVKMNKGARHSHETLSLWGKSTLKNLFLLFSLASTFLFERWTFWGGVCDVRFRWCYHYSNTMNGGVKISLSHTVWEGTLTDIKNVENCSESLEHFRQKFRESNVERKLLYWFQETIFGEEWISRFSTLWKTDFKSIENEKW